jgi:ABC-2 type transport system permease protein
MSATTTAVSPVTTAPTLRFSGFVRMAAVETWYELVKLARMKMYVIPTLAFPAMFYVFFGLAMGQRWSAGGLHAAAYLIATYGAFGVMCASLFGVGIGVAVERGQGWLQVKRATPLPLGLFFLAKVVVALVFSAAVVALLVALGVTFGGVRFALSTWLLLTATLILCALPFCALGLALGYFAGPNSAPAVANLIVMPMAFVSGLWLPSQMLPAALARIGTYLPAYHCGQLALGVAGASVDGNAGHHVIAILASTAVFLVLAALGFARDQGASYG